MNYQQSSEKIFHENVQGKQKGFKVPETYAC